MTLFRITIAICIILLAACNKKKQIDIYVLTNRSNSTGMGTHYFNGEEISKDKYKFVYKNEITGITDTTTIEIEIK